MSVGRGATAVQGASPTAIRDGDDLYGLWCAFRKTRDRAIRDRLILTYAPLVKFVAGRLGSGLPAHVDDNDLISCGLLGLIDAIERYDPDRNVKFETYAITRIKGAIIDELRAMDWVPRTVRVRAREIERAMASLEAQLHRAPTDAEIAEKIGITEEELGDSLTDIARSAIASLDEVWTMSSSGDQVTLINTLEDSEAPEAQTALDNTETRDLLAQSIAALPEREKIVITLYYYEELTLREIGDVLGVTESRVSQLHTQAILRLRTHLTRSPEESTQHPNTARLSKVPPSPGPLEETRRAQHPVSNPLRRRSSALRAA